MAISAIIDLQLDSRHDGDDCVFNGYLEDYLSLYETELDPVLKEAFTTIGNKYPDVRICSGLKSIINKEAISNQIIRYKDVFKLEGKALVYPDILYMSQDNQERALIVLPYTDGSYIYAKGYYYCMTEPGGLFVDCKNEIVAISTNDAQKIVDTFDQLFTNKAGAIQRNLDHNEFENYEALKEKAVTMASEQQEYAKEHLPELEDRYQEINNYIINWFLLKKVLYVQYMVNKNFLNQRHDGNIKKQRNQAKLNADEIGFLSYSELWRLQKDEPSEAVAQEEAENYENEEEGS